MTEEINLADVCVFQRDNMECPLCLKTGMVLMDEWNSPRPCPICRGVGQIKTDNIPTQEEIAMKMLYYFKF